MLKFFRNIRRRLLVENLSRYILYAIGEIVLVVIGILIALQVNNWNELKKQKGLEQEYYCRLLEDALLDKEQINSLLGLAEDRLRASNQAVRLLLDDKVEAAEIGDQIALAIKAIHTDNFANGSNQASMQSGRFLIGMEEDVRKAIPIQEDKFLSEKMKNRLYRESLEYLSVNTRQAGLYSDMRSEIMDLETLLRSKCDLAIDPSSC